MLLEVDALRTIIAVGKIDILVGDEQPCAPNRLLIIRRIRRTTPEARWPASAGIYHSSVALMRRLRGHDVGAGAVAGIGKAGSGKPPQGILIDVAAEALHIWSVRTGSVDSPLVPVKTEPMQVILNLTGIFKAGTLRVKILYAKNPAVALTFAESQETSAENTLPRCILPVGEGANLPVIS